MSVSRRVKEYKDGQPKLQPTTIRATEDCLKRVKKFAKDNGIGEGVALWLLVEEALEGTEGYAAQKVEDPIDSLRKEVGFLKKEMTALWELLDKQTEGPVSDKNVDAGLNSDKLEDIEQKAADQELPTSDLSTNVVKEGQPVSIKFKPRSMSQNLKK